MAEAIDPKPLAVCPLADKVDGLISLIDKSMTVDTKVTPNCSPSKSWAISPDKAKEEFRNYEENPRQEMVRELYRQQHENMTYDFVLKQRAKYLKFDKCVMTIWDMLQYLGDVVDESDPDTDLSQLEHALQTAEAARKAYPSEEYDWLHVTALVHDLGKVMSVKDDALGFVGEPQWATVGDIFPVGCAWSKENVFFESFAKNPDAKDPRYSTKLGVYAEKCGLDNVFLSWSHDEYMYNICKAQSSLPKQALSILRYHSFYPWHSGEDYMYLCNAEDIEMSLKWTRIFNAFDLYSKSDEPPVFEECAPYYQQKIKKYFPEAVRW